MAGFVDDLRRLRGAMSLQEVGSRMGYHSSTVSRRLNPDELPPLDFVRAYVTACGADPGPWEERWRKIPGQPPDRPVRHRRRRWVVIGAVAAVAIAVLVAAALRLYGSAAPAVSVATTSPAPPKSGAGFSWKITRMVSGLTSRTWSQAASGNIEIWANLGCPGNAISYWIALRPHGETVRFSCGSWQHHRWAEVAAGSHHFEVWKEGDGLALSGEGVLASSTLIVEQPKVSPSG
ncbi:helix-turn-helix domain-containing protein [Nonomuraea sediminis]|uniref:helix-turn-helix domain-containing protein n=1 Tax=Nonomuraea sediminis TaxID=2835864 RepID=UPI001BDC9E8B|nr:helix-turn-helix transcriptional regulator [Nonomuraea sediminis]